jgi:hypothetical protein
MLLTEEEAGVQGEAGGGRPAARKLRDDFLFYAPRVLKIMDKDSGKLIPFNLNPIQQKIHLAAEQSGWRPARSGSSS